jgi:hypothetical protein
MGLLLTSASNCESIRRVSWQVSGLGRERSPTLTVAQQPMIYTWFLFNNTANAGGINLETNIKVKNDGAKVYNFPEIV